MSRRRPGLAPHERGSRGWRSVASRARASMLRCDANGESRETEERGQRAAAMAGCGCCLLAQPPRFFGPLLFGPASEVLLHLLAHSLAPFMTAASKCRLTPDAVVQHLWIVYLLPGPGPCEQGLRLVTARQLGGPPLHRGRAGRGPPGGHGAPPGQYADHAAAPHRPHRLLAATAHTPAHPLN